MRLGQGAGVLLPDSAQCRRPDGNPDHGGFGTGHGFPVAGVLVELVGGLFHQLYYLVLAIGELVDAARQDGELVPQREAVETAPFEIVCGVWLVA